MLSPEDDVKTKKGKKTFTSALLLRDPETPVSDIICGQT